MTAAGAPPRGFAVDEFRERTARAQRLMASRGLAGLLLLTEPEVRYFSGFLTQFWQSPTRPWFLIVPAAGDPVAVIPAIGAEAMSRTWVRDIRTWPAPTPDDEGISLLSDTIREILAPGPVGLPMGPETSLRMPLNDFKKLGRTLDGHDFVDAGEIVRTLRMVKSEAEIDKVRFACQAVSGVFERLPELLHSGMADSDVFRTFKIACLEAGVDDVSYLVGGAGPGGYSDIISPPSGRVLQDGDVLILDTGCMFDGYFCDFDRNYAIGRIDDEARRAHDVVWRATEAGLQVARPGARACDVWRAMQDVLTAGGALGNDVGRMGHGLGMQLTEWPSNMGSDETVLEDRMILTLEPGMTFAPGRVMVHEEDIVIREHGPELLTRRAPNEMPVIG
ncbi:MAG: Xaa-Pro peptidase family protein [Rhodospirillales bacterium]